MPKHEAEEAIIPTEAQDEIALLLSGVERHHSAKEEVGQIVLIEAHHTRTDRRAEQAKDNVGKQLECPRQPDACEGSRR